MTFARSVMLSWISDALWIVAIVALAAAAWATLVEPSLGFPPFVGPEIAEKVARTEMLGAWVGFSSAAAALATMIAARLRRSSAHESGRGTAPQPCH